MEEKVKTVEKPETEIKFHEDSGYRSPADISPIYSSSEGETISKKRLQIDKVENHVVVENVFLLNTKMRRKFENGNEPSNCTVVTIRLEPEFNKNLVIDSAKCSRAKSEAYRYLFGRFHQFIV